MAAVTPCGNTLLNCVKTLHDKNAWCLTFLLFVHRVKSLFPLSHLFLGHQPREVWQKILTVFMYCYHNNLLPPLFFNLFLKTVKFMATALEQLIVIACIIAEQIWNNSQFFIKDQRSGIPFLFKSILCQVFPILRKKLLENYWNGKAAHCSNIDAIVLLLLGGLNYKPGGF